MLFIFGLVCMYALSVENFAPAFSESNSLRSHTFVLSGTRVNAKTGSGVRFNRHIDSDLRGFTRETNSLQTFNSNAQNCHHKINTYLLLIQFHQFPCLGSNHNSVYVTFKLVLRTSQFNVKCLQRTCLPCESTEI
jgi:hypothetical protein